jgi:hypothetical protein
MEVVVQPVALGLNAVEFAPDAIAQCILNGPRIGLT